MIFHCIDDRGQSRIFHFLQPEEGGEAINYDQKNFVAFGYVLNTIPMKGLDGCDCKHANWKGRYFHHMELISFADVVCARNVLNTFVIDNIVTQYVCD